MILWKGWGSRPGSMQTRFHISQINLPHYMVHLIPGYRQKYISVNLNHSLIRLLMVNVSIKYFSFFNYSFYVHLLCFFFFYFV